MVHIEKASLLNCSQWSCLFFFNFFCLDGDVAAHLEPKSVPETFRRVPAETALGTVW